MYSPQAYLIPRGSSPVVCRQHAPECLIGRETLQWLRKNGQPQMYAVAAANETLSSSFNSRRLCVMIAVNPTRLIRFASMSPDLTGPQVPVKPVCAEQAPITESDTDRY